MIKLADRFVLENELGSGGMARVYLGRDEVLDRPVAVKVLNPVHGGTDIGDRFEREGRTAARLAHPNIVQVYDAGEALFDGRETSYIVMEYVPGGDLKALIDERGRLPGPELARLGDEVCAGLAHAHERGVIHRDIKPHNILLDEKGHAKVTDFGIARALDTTQATRTGYFLGTALYSSPEQLQGHKVTSKSDIYSLGATLYQAAAGEPPFSGATPIEIASQHVSKSPVPPRQLGADVSEGLQALILDCLAKHPDDRPTADEARSRLETEIPTAGAAQPARPAAATAPTGTEQTRAAPAAPPPGARPGGAIRRESRGRRGGLLAVLALLAVLVRDRSPRRAEPLRRERGRECRSNNAGQNNAQAGGNEGGVDRTRDRVATRARKARVGANRRARRPRLARARRPRPELFGQQSASVQSGLTEQAAEETVLGCSTRWPPDGNYGSSCGLLTEDYQQATISATEATSTSTFDDVESVEFHPRPERRGLGQHGHRNGRDTIATLDREDQRNTGTWYARRRRRRVEDRQL